MFRTSNASPRKRDPAAAGDKAVTTTGISLRDYQLRIAKSCEMANTIVVLPTGSGKTLIAAEVIKRLGPPALFLVPTCLLVEQQAEALRAWTGLDVARYRGGMALPTSFDVLVTTPEAFKVAQRSADDGGFDSSLLQWPSLRVAVFDEVHHVLKDHPYRKLALSLRRSSVVRTSSTPSSPPFTGPRVVGLTASYTYAVGDVKVESSLRSMCSELLVTNTETASLKELKASGYHAIGAAAEVLLTPTAGCSSLPSSPSSPTSSKVPQQGVPLADRKAHDMVGIFFRRQRSGLSTPFARRLMACVRAMEGAVVAASKHSRFASPLPPAGTLAPREWGAYAHKLARGSGGGRGGGSSGWITGRGGTAASKAGSNPNRTPCRNCGKVDGDGEGRVLRPMIAELEHWYEAVKTLLVSWEEADDEAATILDMGGCDPRRRAAAAAASAAGGRGREVEVWPAPVRQIISAFWAEVPETFPRYEHLKDVLMEKYYHHGGDGSGGDSPGSKGGGNAFRGVVFVCQRVTTHVLAHVISRDPELSPLLSTACLYASSSRATASLSVTKAQAQDHLQAFREGRVNLLLATVVAEEGMDIPAANCTIRFDAMLHAVSLVQGRGRARQADSSFVVLRERADRTTVHLEAVEQQQLRLVRIFKPAAPGQHAAADAALLTAQRSRECQARSVLVSAAAAAATATEGAGAISAANLFARKTKVVLEEGWKKAGKDLWMCTLTYESPLREVHSAGKASGKKNAKKLAAAKLIADLLAVVPS